MRQNINLLFKRGYGIIGTMDKKKRVEHPAKASDLTVYTDMQMFLLALEQTGLDKEKLLWVVYNWKSKKLFSTYCAWHFAGRPYEGDDRWGEFKNLDFSYIGEIEEINFGL